MIAIDELNREISELESADVTYTVIERLAWFYTIRDHMEGRGTASASNVPVMNGSEFLTACSGAPLSSLLNILDDHMEAIQIIHPREYATLIRKIQMLKSI